MKWNKMSVFHKITAVVSTLCAVAYIYISVFSIFGLLPSVHTIPWAQALFGISWVGSAILYWKKMRILAIFNLVMGVLVFVNAFFVWFTK